MTTLTVTQKTDLDKSGNDSLGVLAKLRKLSTNSTKTNTTDDAEHKPPGPMALLRRRSTFKSIATGLLGFRRLTKGNIKAEEESKPKIKLENTYKIDPDEGREFRGKNVEKVVANILEEELRNEKYNHDRCKMLACDLSVKIKSKVKNMGFPRYKIICNVVIGQCMDQGVEMASQSIWDPKTDNYSCSSYKNSTLFAVALVHGVYFE